MTDGLSGAEEVEDFKWSMGASPSGLADGRSGSRFVGVGRELHRTARDNRADGVFVDHLRDRVAQQDHILVKRFDLPLQLDAVDQVDGHRHVLAAELVQEGVLQELAFVVAHDMLRVQRV